MSVKVHEAFSLDSFQDRLLFFDDFHGDQVQDEWRTNGAGSAAVVDAQTGGIVRLTTGATQWDQYYLDWNTIRTLLVSKKATMETRVKLTQTTNVDVWLRLQFDVNNWIVFVYNSATSANWLIQCRDGGVGGTLDSGIAADTDYHIFRIETFPTGEVHFYIDGVETTNSPIVANIPDDAADYLEPSFLIQTRENVAKSVDIDYVYIRQER